MILAHFFNYNILFVFLLSIFCLKLLNNYIKSLEMKKISAGILVYCKRKNRLEILLVHPGGPFWKNKDIGVWSIPKGEIKKGEDILETAKREFKEETGIDLKIDKTNNSRKLIFLGSATQKNGKIVYAWAIQCRKPFNVQKIKSNLVKIEFPPNSSKFIEFPEVDRAEFFDLEKAAKKIVPGQIKFLEQLKKITLSQI